MPTGERGLLEPSELWPTEQQLCLKASEGGVLDLRSRQPGQDDPARGQEWGTERQIRAQVLFQLVTGQGPVLVDSVVAVRLQGARILGRLNLGGSTLRCSLELSQCYLRHRLDLAKAEAPNISLQGSYLHSRLSARRLLVAHTLNLNGLRCSGGIVLVEAHIRGQLNCATASLQRPDGKALNADRLLVGDNMRLDRARCSGEVRLLEGHIKGQLNCAEAIFTNADAEALNADRLLVGTYMRLDRAECTGEVRLLGGHIEGQLSCTEAVFSKPDGNALNCDGLLVDDNMRLDQARCAGEVRMLGAHIDGQLNCTGASFSNPDGLAINLERATVVQAVYMYPASLHGGLGLSHARVGVWHDERSTWPRRIDLNGFTYDAIDANNASAKDRLRSWLPRVGYLPQPYEQLAGLYRREGNESAARAVSIGKQRARRADHSRWWVRWPSVTWSALLRWSIGYGYRPALALIPLIVLVTAGSLLFQAASQDPMVLHAAKPGTPEQPGFNAFRYTMDLLLPVVNFKQRDSFVVDGWAAWATFGFNLAGWMLAAIVVAGLAGIFNKN